jgi:4-hydroxybenzoate polyprenyltransferase
VKSAVRVVSRGERIRGWLELVRPVNLFTIPGDILVGAVLAGATWRQLPAMLPAVLVSLMLYAAGLLLNDYVDRDREREERPSRPIPSGRVYAVHVMRIGVLFLAGAAVLSAMISAGLRDVQVMTVTLVLIGLIILYNTAARRVPVLGFLTMGACRGCNILLGAGVGGSLLAVPVLWAAAIETAYIMMVSSLAVREAESPAVTPDVIGRLIRALILLQIAFIFIFFSAVPASASFMYTIVLVLGIFFMSSRRMAVKFYGS